MPTNEFEKQVQKQLDDFQLNPSASVWEKVEDQIKRKKRRRIIIFFLLPLAFGLLGLIGYQFLYTGPKTEVAERQDAAKNEKSLSTDKNNVPAEIKERPFITPSQEINDPAEINKEKNTFQKKTTYPQENQLQISSTNPSTGRRKNKPIAESNDKTVIVKKEAEPLSEINKNVPGKQDITVTVEKPRAETDPKNEITKSPEPGKNYQNDKVTIAEEDIVPVKTDSIKKDEGNTGSRKEAIVKNKTGKPRISWGIDFFAGIAASNDAAFSFNKSSRFADVSYSGPGTGSPGGNPPPQIPPSSVKSGPAFSIGLTAELQISERSRISTGLGYVYASNRIKTGPGTDTLVSFQTSNGYSNVQVNRVYIGVQQNDHTNKYHFIQVPLWYHWQINKGKKLPLQWNMGVSVSYLVATNALVYDTGLGGIYYNNKDAFNKMHFNVGTGLSLRLKAKNKMEWVLGPEISFDLSKLMINTDDKKQYLLFGGIHTKLFFPKKKAK